MANTPTPLRDVIADRLLPATAFAYMHCDVPAGMRLDEWHVARNRGRRAARAAARREGRRALAGNLRRCMVRT